MSNAAPITDVPRRYLAPEQVTFQKVERGIPPRPQGDYSCSFLIVNGNPSIHAWASRGLTMKYDLNFIYAAVKNEDVIAMMGALYRVTTVNSDSVDCARLDKQDFPAHIWPSSEIIVPFGRTASGSGCSLYNGGIQVLSIDKPRTEGKQALTAEMRITQPRERVEKKMEDRGTKHRVKVGDLIPVNDSKLHFRIEKIVPADEDKKIYGWVELSADPVAK